MVLFIVVEMKMIAYPTITRSTLTDILNLIDKLIFESTNIPPGLSIRKHCRAMFHDCTQGCDESINIKTT